MTATQPPRTIRERTCIACGSKLQKGSLLRVVRTPDGDVRFDPTGRAAGRGAYACSPACLERALSGRAFERALRCSITGDDKERISAEARRAPMAAKADEGRTAAVSPDTARKEM